MTRQRAAIDGGGEHELRRTGMALEKCWPPTKTWKISIGWALGLGFILQIAIPGAFALLGARRVALSAELPGLLPILWATRGWFAGITFAGYVLMFSVNTLVYGLLLFAGFRTCACLRRHYA
jgi:hypothetical protein